MKILVVDDDENARVYLERSLRAQKYDVESAANGVIALEKVRQWHPDLIISDILMPEMNGFELCGKIKTDEQLKNIPFIFYTATFVDQEDEKLAMALGASRFLIKPLESADFFRIIREVINEYETKELSVPCRPLAEMKDLCQMQENALARKLDKKVRELEKERGNLRRNKLLLSQTQQMARVGGWEYDVEDGRIVWTDEVYRIYGVSPDEYDPNNIAQDIAFYENRAAIENAFRRAVEFGEPYDLELKFRNARGESLHVRTMGRAEVINGRVVRVSGTIMDISDRKQAEEELKFRNVILSTQQEASIEGILVVDESGRILSFNRRFCELWNISSEVLETKSDEHALQAVLDNIIDPENFLQKVRYLYEHHQEISRDEISLRDGRTFDCYSAPMFGIDNRYYGRVWYFSDITERKRAEEDLKKAITDLERSNKELEQFAYVASHDLKQPVRTMASYAEFLALSYKGKLAGDADIVISSIVEGAKHMDMLIEDLLAYSRLSRPGKPVEEVNMGNVFEQVKRNLQKEIEGSGASASSGPLPVVMGDASQMVQLLQNLIANAIIFRRGDETPLIHVSAEVSGSEFVFAVQDNGIGIEAAFHERIFTIFQRLHTKEQYPGTGIGLAICKRIIEGHGGRFWVESEKGKGSTFYFTIPHKGKKAI